ncbi:MAG: hypothetical protein GC160_16180 [Acidobacteria bacterium]|nr:hypothetical protein [Acidobacteriota bacterium]
MRFLDLYPLPFDSATIAILFVQLVFLLLSFVYGVLKIPSLVNSIFSGRSGESALREPPEDRARTTAGPEPRVALPMDRTVLHTQNMRRAVFYFAL